MEERNGFPYHEDPVELKLTTHLPTKWLTIDQETGDVWEGTETGSWKNRGGLTAAHITELKDLASSIL